MIHDIRGEDEMIEAELRKYKQFVEDSKKISLSPLWEVVECNRGSEASATKGCSWLDKQEFQSIASSPEGYAAEGNMLSDTVYEAKKIVRPVGLKIEKNSCMLS